MTAVGASTTSSSARPRGWRSRSAHICEPESGRLRRVVWPRAAAAQCRLSCTPSPTRSASCDVRKYPRVAEPVGQRGVLKLRHSNACSRRWGATRSCSSCTTRGEPLLHRTRPDGARRRRAASGRAGELEPEHAAIAGAVRRGGHVGLCASAGWRRRRDRRDPRALPTREREFAVVHANLRELVEARTRTGNRDLDIVAQFLVFDTTSTSCRAVVGRCSTSALASMRSRLSVRGRRRRAEH